MKKYLTLILIILIGTSCEKIVDIEIPAGEPVLVVDGQITNQLERWVIQLSLSQSYFDQSERNDVSDAQVYIESTDGTTVDLVYTNDGIYVSDDPHQCIPGETYTLFINYNGKEYVASEVMPNGFPIDLMLSFYLPNNNGFIQEGYYVFIQGKENDYKGDSYQWNFYRNDTLEEGFGPLLENDEFGLVSYLNPNIDPDDPLAGLDDNILPRPFPFLVEPGDTIRIEQLNLSPQYYQYIIDLNAQLSRSGAPFDPPPTNPNNNISNGAMGYFSVAHFTDKEIVIEP